MSYIATLAACLLGRLKPKDGFITSKGSSHGANGHFPVELYNKQGCDSLLTKDDWKIWHEDAVKEYGSNGLCIVKDGWVKLGTKEWENCVNQLDYSIAIVSQCDNQLDWLYAWFNMVDKIPKHIYYRLRQKSIYYPKMWNLLSKHKKIAEMIAAMPIYPLGDNPNFSVPSLHLSATDVLDNDFPKKISEFLDLQGLNTVISEEILRWHDTFVAKQQMNLMKARLIMNGDRWKAQGPFDHILFSWLDSQR